MKTLSLKKFRCLIILVFLLLIVARQTGYGQEQHTPYPIIFIHGCSSNDETWDVLSDFLKTKYGMSYGGRMDFCLNQDANTSTSNIIDDYKDYTNIDDLHKIVKADFYTINFDVDNFGTPHDIDIQSNQSAIVKQGLAIRDAIKHVLLVTGRDKVILVGHSMGGLAAREYLQNKNLWQEPYMNHHVAKLCTIGTPHGGSNATDFGTGISPMDLRSEAVRDLRTSYFYSYFFPGGAPYPNIDAPGTYLFGGVEDLSYMKDQYCCKYYNADVNCDGNITGQGIAGLNKKFYPTNLAYSCIIGIGDKFGGDGVVSSKSANTNNYLQVNADEFPLIKTSGLTWHTELPKQIAGIMQAMDEPAESALAYEIGETSSTKGFITFGSYQNIVDIDMYKVNLKKDGLLTINIDASSFTGITSINLIDANSDKPVKAIYDISEKIEFQATSGIYYIKVRGIAVEDGPDAPGSYKYPYTLNTQFSITPTASMAVSPATLQFYDVVMGTPKNKTITMTNNGDTDFSITALDLSGSNADQFSIINSLPFTIISKTSQMVTVRFNPTSTGNKAANLTITTDSPDIAAKTVSLEGNATELETKVLTFNTATLHDYGDTKLNNSKSKTFAVQNTGSNPVIISNLVVGGSNPESFTITSPSVVPFDIGSGETKSIVVQFLPTAIGSKSANLTIANNSNNSSNYSIGLSGNGIENYLGTHVSGTISSDVTWTLADSPYIVTSTITINHGAVLTIEPGVTVKFNAGQSLYVNGTLVASRTIFTSSNTNPVAGDWSTIQVGNGNVSDYGTLILDSCQIYYASHIQAYNGKATLINTDLTNLNYYGVTIEAMGTLNMSGGKITTNSAWAATNGSGILANPNAHSSISGVTILNFQNGIQLNNNAKTAISNISITSCNWPIVYNASADLTAGGTNSFAGNTKTSVFMNFSSISDTLTLPVLNIPYYFSQGMTVNSSSQLIIGSNNILKFPDWTSLTVSGTLVANANPDESIYFTSYKDDNWGGDTNMDGSATAPTSGIWYGIKFEDSSVDADCVMRRCNVRYAGANNTGGISMSNASPTIDECDLTNNYFGVYMQYASNPIFNNNTIGSSQMTPIAMSFEADPTMTNNVLSFSDNAYDAIGLIGGTLTANATVKVRSVNSNPNITYLLLDQVTIPSGKSLTIDKGIVIKAISDYWNPRRIIVDGSLIVDATADNMVTFTSAKDDNFGSPGDTNKDGTITSPAIGDWGGIIFNSGSTGLLNYCRIKYASISNYTFTNCGNTEYLNEAAVGTIDASPTISNCEFKDLNYGISCYRASNPTISNNSMTNIKYTPICISGSSNPTISGITFTNVGWRAIGLLGGNVCLDGTIKKRDMAGFTNITYVLLANMTVNSGTYVNIEPGVVIKFNQWQDSYCGGYYGCSIYVDGGFKTYGTSNQNVVFTSIKDDNEGNPIDSNGDGNASTPAPGDWGYIKYRSTSDDAYCNLNHSTIKYSGKFAPCQNSEGAVAFENSGGQLLNSIITNSFGYGVYCNGNSTPTVDNVNIQNCSLDPIAMSLTSSPTFTNITFTSNFSQAIKIIEGTLSSDATLATRNVAGITNIAYVVNQLTISSNAKLTIQPDVVIKFRGDPPNYITSTSITVNGTLIANGTASHKIYFTSYADDSRGGDSNNNGNTSSPTKGDWGSGYYYSYWGWSVHPGGIMFVNNSLNADTENSMKNCEISYAGTGLRIENSYVNIDNCTIQLAQYFGAAIVGSANPDLNNCQFYNIAYSPIELSMFSNPTFTNCTALNVGYMALSVIPETYSQTATVPVRNFGGYTNINYLLMNPCTINSGTTITIPEGVIFKSTSNMISDGPNNNSGTIANGFIVNGRLNIQGTIGNPVIFTNSADDTYGNPKDMNQDGTASVPPPIGGYIPWIGQIWQGNWLTFNDVSDDLSSVNNAIFKYGDKGISTLSASPSIDYASFENLLYGVDMNGVSSPKIDNCTFNNLQYYPIQISLVSYPASSTNNTISGTTYKVIKVRDETLTQDVTLPKRSFGGLANIPYYWERYTIGTGASLSIEPGVVCKFLTKSYWDTNVGLDIFKGLTAIGGASPESNIVFTSIKDDFYGGDSNSDNNATSAAIGDWNGLIFENESLDPMCTLKNCIIRFADKGVQTKSASPAFENCNFNKNNYGVYATATSNPVFSNCDFKDNYYFAIDNVDKSFVIDATNCWWGNNLGPIQSETPRNGTGVQEIVTDAVNYTPWKTMGAGNPLTGDVSLNGIVQAYDAALILQNAVGSLTLNSLQQQVADVSGEAGITAYDASLILQYVVGTRQSFPAELKSADLSEFTNPQLVVGSANAIDGQEVKIPLNVTNVSNLVAAEIRLQYDPERLKVNQVTQIVSGMNLLFSNDSKNGILTIAMAGIVPLKSDTILAEITFQTLLYSGYQIKNDLTVNKFIANETDMTSWAINGTITTNSNSTGISTIKENEQGGMLSVYPNPSSGNAFLAYQLNVDNQMVNIEVYNMMGQKVVTLVNETKDKGKYLISLSEHCRSLECGSYFIRMTVKGFSQSQKFLIVR